MCLSTCLKVRVQLAGVGSLLLPHRSLGLNSELRPSDLAASTFASDQSCWTTGVDFMGKSEGMETGFPRTGGR